MKYSKEGQDQFALLCNKNAGGFFLDLGSAHPWDGNNTVRLEEMGWQGVRFDINPHVERIPSVRTSPVVIGDISRRCICDLHPKLLGRKHVDYISFDVDDGTLGTIENFPWAWMRFTCMTFEHDKRSREYSPKQAAMDQALHGLGYLCLARDVCYEDGGNKHVFEDWWVDPKKVPEEFIYPLPDRQTWKAVLEMMKYRKQPNLSS